MTRPAVRMVNVVAGAALVAACGLVGGAIAVASSPHSLQAVRSGAARSEAAAGAQRGTPARSPAAGAAAGAGSGTLGQDAALASYPAALVATGASRAWESVDHGRQWRSLAVPDGGGRIAVDPLNPDVALAGGDSLRRTADVGAHWAGVRHQPPPPGPWVPLLISSTDHAVWFVAHQGRLARTRDAGANWADLPGLPPLPPSPVMVQGAGQGQFVLAVDNLLFELNDNGQRVKALPSLPADARFSAIAVAGGTPAVARGSDGRVYLMRDGIWVDPHLSVHGPVAAAHEGRLWVGNGSASLSSPGEVAYSDDGGLTWGLGTGLADRQTVEALAALGPDGSTVVAYCFGGDVYASDDGGRSWSQVSTAFRPS